MRLMWGCCVPNWWQAGGGVHFAGIGPPLHYCVALILRCEIRCIIHACWVRRCVVVDEKGRCRLKAGLGALHAIEHARGGC